MTYTEKVCKMIMAATEYPDASHGILPDILAALERLAKTNTELDRLLAMAIGEAVHPDQDRPPAPSQLTAAIVSQLRSKIALSFGNPDANCPRWSSVRKSGYFQFAGYGQLTGWFPDLLGAKHAPKNCIRVQMEGPAFYWTNNGREFEKVT